MLYEKLLLLRNIDSGVPQALAVMRLQNLKVSQEKGV